MTLSRELARFVVGTPAAALPPLALDYAEMLIASTIASAALGSTLESTKIVRALETERGGRADATVWFGAGEKLPVAAAARINALASDAAASDDSHLDYIIHHGTTAASTALAVGELTGASGAEMVAAIVLGYEVTCRLIRAMHFSFKDKAFHGCIVASFAGTSVAARLLKLDETRTAHALALTATSMGGLSAAANTSVAREWHAGMAAMQAVNATLAAARGYTAEEAIFEMPRGFFVVHADKADVASVTRGLGEHWSLTTDMGIKLVPGTHPFHAIAEAAAQAAIAGDVRPDEVEEVAISRPGWQGFANVHAPTDLIGIAHSALYFAAAAVVDRNYTWVHAFEEKINDPAIRRMLGKVRMADPPTEHLERYRSGAIVTIRLRDGRTHSATVHAPRGSAPVGIAWADVEDKYRALVPYAGLGADSVEASLRVIRGFRRVQGASELTNLLS